MRRAAGDSFKSRYNDPVGLFWEKVDKRGPDDCWPWGGTLEKHGHGQYIAHLDGIKFTKAHRFAYHIAKGPIPKGLMLDHLCHTHSDCTAGDECLHRRCVNPAHLEVVTAKENRARAHVPNLGRDEFCPRGHVLAETRSKRERGFRCLACRRERQALKRSQQDAA